MSNLSMILARVFSMTLESSSWDRFMLLSTTSEHLEISSAASAPKVTMDSRLYTSIWLARASTSGELTSVWVIICRSAEMSYC